MPAHAAIGTPTAHLVIGSLVPTGGGGWGWTLTGVLGAIILIDAAVNLVPLGRGSDGWKLWVALWHLLTGRAHHTAWPVTSPRR